MKKIFTTIFMVAIGVISSFAQVYTIGSIPNDASMGTVTMEMPNQGKILPGAFSVNATKKVRFSPGNLQYQASTKTWRFASNQYDYIGDANSNISSTYTGWIDLFGWGTSGYNGKNPYMTTALGSIYGNGSTNIAGTNYDWGVYNAISNGGNAKGLWRTLTKNEWNYLFNSRTNYNKLWSFATVNGISGVVLLPDSWFLPSGLTFTAASKDFGTNVYTVAQWTKMENEGAVFLPAAGNRTGTSVSNVGSIGYYWSSTCSSSDNAYKVSFSSGDLYPSNYSDLYRYEGRSVRLCAEF